MLISSKVSLQQSSSLVRSSRATLLNDHNLQSRSRLDLGGNRLQTARSLRPYLQGFTRPGTNRALRDATGSTDPDYYRLFDNSSKPLTFQGNGSLLLGCNLINRSTAPISIQQLNKQGAGIPNSFATVQSGESFSYPDILRHGTFYLKVTSNALGQNRYELNLPIINS